MLIKRNEALSILPIFDQTKDLKFNIHTQYKLIKLKKSILEEQEIYTEQILSNCSEYFEMQDGRPVINEQGGYKVKEGYLIQCQDIIRQINACEVQLPDIYFSLDELEPLNLTFEQLELLSPFIK